MAFQLHFGQRYRYDSLESGITVEAALRYGEAAIKCAAKIDTGAQVCLFEREIGEYLGLEIEGDVKIELRTLMGTLPAYVTKSSWRPWGSPFKPLRIFLSHTRFTETFSGDTAGFN
jgi:hypothetical protein